MSIGMAKYLKENNLCRMCYCTRSERAANGVLSESYLCRFKHIYRRAAKILDFDDNGNNNGPKAINSDDTAAFIKMK